MKVPTIKWGIAIDTFQVVEREIESGETLSDLLVEAGMAGPALQQLIHNAGSAFDLRRLRAGTDYTLLTKDSTAAAAAHFIVWQPNPFEYIMFDLKGKQTVERVAKEVETQTTTASGIINGSLWGAMVENGYSYELADKLESALQWSVDFHHLQNGDEFRAVYDRHYVEGEEVGVGEIKAAYYKTGGQEFYALYYESEDGKWKGFFDEQGRPMKEGFLKAPVKYSRISSAYNLSRLHPILKRRKPHFGTDYAAPYGTPIIAVGDGTVLEATRRGGNGNFVKIKHNDTYQTQYLHMQGFAKGIRPGVRVKQGQTIGFVGSTGLATGPHVCFRFWKNGQQVNHLKLDLPPADPLPKSEMPRFTELRDEMVSRLEGADPRSVAQVETRTP